ncbi:MAG: hypothetical protein ACPGYV_03490 [Phycisphaeraceae bacterium]
MNVTLQIGDIHRAFDTDVLPPVGAHIMIHKHLTSDGAGAVVEVISHEWQLDQGFTEDGEEDLDDLNVTIKTKIVR